MQSYLIFGGNPEERLTTIKKLIAQTDFGKGKLELKSHPDILFLESEKAIGIDQVRELKHHLSFKPFAAKFKITIIPTAEKLTLPAQNALLKLLEEPPAKCLVFLSAPSKKQLLATIISRCRLIHLQEKPEIEIGQQILNSQFSILNSVLRSSPGKRILLAEEAAGKGREEAILFCQQLLFLIRQLLFQKLKIEASKQPKLSKLPHLQPLSLLKSLNETQFALKYLQSNVNPKLALENLFLSLPQVGDKIN